MAGKTVSFVATPSGEIVDRPARAGDRIIVDNGQFIRTYTMTDALPRINPDLTIPKQPKNS